MLFSYYDAPMYLSLCFYNITSSSKLRRLTHPRVKAPDHWSRNPKIADMIMAVELLRSHWKESTPGGSNDGIRANKKNIVVGVVFHISLHTYIFSSWALLVFFVFLMKRLIADYVWQKLKRANTYARAVQLPSCCRLDHSILFIALGIIHAIAIKAPNRLNSKSVTVATATPVETTTKAKTCVPKMNLF